VTSATLPATQIPGTCVRPVGSARMPLLGRCHAPQLIGPRDTADPAAWRTEIG
jgi:hypothetical protein